MSYRAVFFDAGETLVHPYPSFPELFTQLVTGEGHHVDEEKFRAGLIAVSEHFSRTARDGILWSASADASKGFWLGVYRLLLEGLDLPVTDGLPEKLYIEFSTLSNYRLFPDVGATLDRLVAAGLRLGVISNFEEWLERLLASLDVARYFDVRIISGVEGMEKPDPRIFRLALDRMGVAAAQAAYVGDNPEFDTKPAEKVGMLGVLLDRRGRFPDHEGIRISGLDELTAVLGV